VLNIEEGTTEFSTSNFTLLSTKPMITPYKSELRSLYTVTNLLKALLGNGSVNVPTHAPRNNTLEMFSMFSVLGSSQRANGLAR
jgi:hypothetical protein